MTAGRWRAISGLFEEALELPAAERAAFVDQRAVGDAELREVVQRMLASEEAAADYLETPALAIAGEARLGPWRTIREIGRGGMGVVFLGERADGAYEQKVAIKITPGALDNESVLLARLEHPAIARLLDAGSTPEGFPYLVMEFVDGLPVDQWVREWRPDEKLRLRVFDEICGAVQYAHRNLVLHRDLKPSNVMVTRDHRPRLLDFGIAKELDAASTVTRFPAASPEYASPEQLSGDRLTTASDVFSLGLLLHTILVGRPLRNLEGLAAREAIERALEDCSGGVAVGGDLGQVIRKAIRPEPGDRYGSAAELAEEIRRYEQGLPVLAQPPTFRYRAVRFLRRHRGKVAMATAVTMALTVTAGAAMWQARMAGRRFAQVRELAGSVLYELHDSIAGLPGSNPARLLLSQRALRYLEALSAEAGSDSGIWNDVASGYLRLGDVQGGSAIRNLGQYAEAEHSYRKAHEIAQRLLAERPGELEARLLELGTARAVMLTDLRGSRRKEALEEAERLVRECDELRQANPGDPRVRRLLADVHLARVNAYVYNAMPEKTLPALFETVKHYEALPREDYIEKRRLAGAYQFLADEHLRRKNLAEARRSVERATEVQQDAVHAHPNLISARMDLSLCHYQMASVLTAEGDYAGAVAALDRMIPIREQLVAEEPTDVVGRAWLAAAHANRGQNLIRLGRTDAAVGALETALEQYLALYDAERTSERYVASVADTEVVLAKVLHAEGHKERACRLYRSALERLVALTPEARKAARNPEAESEIGEALKRCPA